MRRKLNWLIVLLCLGGLSWYVKCAGRPYRPSAASFSGRSTGLNKTVILAALDAPLPKTKSALWSAAVELTWNQMRRDLFRGPIRLEPMSPTAQRLNRSALRSSAFTPESVYVYAGAAGPQELEQIQWDVQRQFPGLPPPILPAPSPDTILGYAMLKVSIPFSLPYFDYDEPFVFKGADGKSCPVAAFGIPPGKHQWRLRQQVEIMFAKREGVTEFAVDVCRTSHPYRLALALIPRPATLGAGIARVQALSSADHEGYDRGSTLGSDDSLLIPNQNWDITHVFAELKGQVTSPPLTLQDVRERLAFRLDRSGAELTAGASIMGTFGIPQQYHFNRPFLLFMEDRASHQAIFAMWVDNDELLMPPNP